MANHIIWIRKASDGVGHPCLQVFDNDTDGSSAGNPAGHERGAALRKRLMHDAPDTITWQAVDVTSTLKIKWATGTTAPFAFQNPQPNQYTVVGVGPATASFGRYKYTIELTPSGEATISEDPQIIIDNTGSMPPDIEVIEHITVIEEVSDLR
jgi:hypothetical protein